MFFVTALGMMDMMREYVRRSKYRPDMEKLRELLSKLTDVQKLSILQQYKSKRDGTALHKAACRGDAEMITNILSSLESSHRLEILLIRDSNRCTPLHISAWLSHTKSVKAILNSLTADQQKRLLIEEDMFGKAAVELASGETADVLSEYKNRAKVDSGEFIPVNRQIVNIRLFVICPTHLWSFVLFINFCFE